MSSELSIFAARLRNFISLCANEPAFAPGDTDLSPLASHAAEFNDMALALFALQFQRNPPYQKFCEARNVSPDSISRWTQIPAMPTAAFKELEITCLPPEARTRVFHSSGTTEQRPSRHYHSAESLAVYEASLWPWFELHVLPEFAADSQSPIANSQSASANRQSALRPPPSAIILTPPPAQAPHSSLVHMFEVVRCKLGVSPSAFTGEIVRFGSWTLDFCTVRAALRESTIEGRPLLLLGTAFSFVHLMDDLAEQNLRFDLPSGSRVMETGGYKGRSRALSKAELHSLITDRLCVPTTHLVCEYGMSELSSQAYDGEVPGARYQVSGVERLFRFPPWARAQVISPESGHEVFDGETGLLRIFDLANVFSVMALQTEDLAVRRRDGFELIGRTELAEPRGCSLMAQSAIRPSSVAVLRRVDNPPVLRSSTAEGGQSAIP